MVNNKDVAFPCTVYHDQTMRNEANLCLTIISYKLLKKSSLLSSALAQQIHSDNNKIGVLFIIKIHPCIKSTTDMCVAEFSEFPNKKENLL